MLCIRDGNLAQRVNQLARAVHLYWAFRSINDSIGAWQEDDEAEFELDLEAFRVALGESEFEETIANGRTMTMEQAIAYALEDQE